MPTLIRLSDCSLHMYAGDHLPPHFHVRLRDGREALIEIAGLSVLRGNLSARTLQSALDWAHTHHSELSATWRELNP